MLSITGPRIDARTKMRSNQEGVRWLRAARLAVVTSIVLMAAGAVPVRAVLLDFLPEKMKFTFKSIGKIERETLSGKKISCLAVTGTGEGVSARLGIVEFDFTDCTSLGGLVKCTSLADPEGTILVKGEYHLRHLLSPNEAWVNLAILVTSAHFSCAGILFVVKGCMASMDLLTDEKQNVVNLLLKLFLVNFLQEKGEQKPLEIDTDSSLGMEPCDLFSKEGNGAEETLGELGELVIEKCEKEAKECTFLFDLSGNQ